MGVLLDNFEPADVDRLAKFRNLVDLRLPSKTKDEDLPSVASLRSLTYLGLNGSDVADKGLLHLRKLSGLRCLDLRNTSVSAEAVQELRQQLPGCVIAWKYEFIPPIKARPWSQWRFMGYQKSSDGLRALRGAW